MENAADKWSEYWRQEGAGGEVFVDGGGGKHPYLADYWRTQIAGCPPQARIIDIAAGGGSIFSNFDTQPVELYGVDLSFAAIKLLQERMPAVGVIVASASHLPFAPRSFDLVVSQFGIEYAGDTAFTEAANLIAPGGRFACLCHIENGYIDARNKQSLDAATRAIESGFIQIALQVTDALFAGSKKDFDIAHEAFVPAEQVMADIIKATPEGIHAHLYFGFRQLSENYKQYDKADVTGWIADMSDEITRSIDRWQAMRAAACTEPRIKSICKQLVKNQFANVGYSPVQLPDHDLPLAWSITAERKWAT